MPNLILVDSNGNALLQAIGQSLDQHQIRKINDISNLVSHVKEFNPDLIIISLAAINDLVIDEFIGIADLITVPVMVFCAECSASHINKLIEADVSYIGTEALPNSAIDKLILVAYARFRQIQKLKSALEEARTQLEDRKRIDRAKAILIKTRNISEEEAYHTLRKLAMGRNITLGEMARNVIAMADLLK